MANWAIWLCMYFWLGIQVQTYIQNQIAYVATETSVRFAHSINSNNMTHNYCSRIGNAIGTLRQVLKVLFSASECSLRCWSPLYNLLIHDGGLQSDLPRYIGKTKIYFVTKPFGINFDQFIQCVWVVHSPVTLSSVQKRP